VVVFLIGNHSLFAQDFKKPIRSSGTIPESFFVTSNEKFQKSWEEFKLDGADEDKRVMSEQEYFFLQTNYGIDQIKTSGQVFVNDEVGRYMSKILDRLLKGNSELRDELDIYLLKSNVVNAFASDLGSIFVTTGLFSRLENEAQLAFILAHEISHFTEKHNIEGATNRAKVQLEYKSYGNLEESYELARIHGYSRKLEVEADSLGMQIYLKSGYSLASIQSVFDLLSTAEYTTSDLEFVIDSLSPYLILTDRLDLEEVDEIEVDEEEDDSESTHPNIASRRAFVERRTADISDSSRVAFLATSPEKFLELRERVNYFNCNLLLNQQLYEAAFYEAYLMHLKYPKDPDLLQIMGRALYGKQVLDNYKLDKRSRSWRKVDGEAQRVYHFMQRSSTDNLNKIAAIFNFRFFKDHPSDYNKQMAEFTVSEFAKKTELEYEDISKDSTGIEVKRRRIPKSKRDQYGGKKYVYDTIINPITIALFELSKDTLFEQMMDPYQDIDIENISELTDALNSILGDDDATITIKTSGFDFVNREKQGYSFGVDSLMVVDPLYLKADNRKKRVLFQEAESKEQEVINSMETTAQNLGLYLNVLDVKSSSGIQARMLDDIYQLKQISGFYMDDEYEKKIRHLVDPATFDLAERYGTSKVLWTGIISAKQKLNRLSCNSTYAACLLLAPQACPFYVYDNVRNDYTYGFHLLVDIKTGRMIQRNAFEIAYPDSKAFIQAYYYDLLNQIHRK
jgi:Zn-dependent protease with chaperone function